MTSVSIYPKSNDECRALLKALGFKRVVGIGRGKHPEKYRHPKKQNIVEGDWPFVTITHDFFNANGQHLMKKVRNWGFTKGEVEYAYKYKRLPEPEEQSETSIDVEPEEA